MSFKSSLKRVVVAFFCSCVFVTPGGVNNSLNRERHIYAMDQETANALFEEGAILVFLDMPEGSEFGMDFNSWNVGPNFRGMKMIPAGVHFVYYR